MVMTENVAAYNGHTYRVRMTAKSNKLNPSKYLKTPDMVCDFRELKWAGKDVEKGGMDHAYLNDLVDFPTSAERLAEYIHAEIDETDTIRNQADSYDLGNAGQLGGIY